MPSRIPESTYDKLNASICHSIGLQAAVSFHQERRDLVIIATAAKAYLYAITELRQHGINHASAAQAAIAESHLTKAIAAWDGQGSSPRASPAEALAVACDRDDERCDHGLTPYEICDACDRQVPHHQV